MSITSLSLRPAWQLRPRLGAGFFELDRNLVRTGFGRQIGRAVRGLGDFLVGLRAGFIGFLLAVDQGQSQ
ncbi:MAG: hypothetical protein JRJ87_19485 [Deltaproteobacteria bacterium]|nr:hypothetical protein [Deltaproteobacteria bacterium]